VGARYGGAGRLVRGFVAGKLRRDPVNRLLLDLAARNGGFGSVADIGCGRGQLGLALLAAGLATRVTGLDRNAAHLAQGVAAARQANPAGGGQVGRGQVGWGQVGWGHGLPALAFHAVCADLADGAALPAADTVLLIDVLYQLHPARQRGLLDRAMRAAGRRLLIRTADPALGLRSRLTRGFELAVWRLSPHSGDHVAPPAPAALAGVLGGAGFAVSILPCWQGTPFANVLVVAARQSASAMGK
jgi:SAM-dependent methyltransferase